MAAMKTGRWRRLWLNVHLWIGVGLLLALAPLGLSGSALVWDGPLDRMLHPARVVAGSDRAALGPTAYLAAAQTAFGDRARANQLRWPTRPGEPVVVSGRLSGAAGGGGPPRTLNAWVDPATSRVLDIGDPRASLIGTLHRLHGNLLLPGNGRAVVGWLGWAMAASCLTGLWLWWPRGNWLAGLGWRRGPHAWSDLHHMAGFWICVPLFVLSITGVYIAFPKASHALVGAPPPASGGAGEARAVGEGRPAGPPRMTADAVLAAALSAAPGARPLSLTAPAGGGRAAWRVQARPGEGPAITLLVNDADGQVRPGAASGRDGADPVSRLMRNLHDGDDTPALWKGIITLAGAAPTLLGVTGVVIWLRRPKRPRPPRSAA